MLGGGGLLGWVLLGGVVEAPATPVPFAETNMLEVLFPQLFTPTMMNPLKLDAELGVNSI